MKQKPTPRLQVVAKPSAAPKTKRITLTLDTTLYTQIEALANEQRRDLRAQCVFVLETAVKAAAGQKRTKARKDAIRRRWEEL